MKFLQKLGKALMLPVAVLPICGILMGIGYYLCPATMQGGDIEGVKNLIGFFLVKAGSALIENMAILFAIGVGVGMSEKNDGTGGIAALASWLMITTLLSTGVVTTLIPSIADNATKTLAFNKIANPFIGILSGVIGSSCYNKFKNTKLPNWLAFFSYYCWFSFYRCICCFIICMAIAVRCTCCTWRCSCRYGRCRCWYLRILKPSVNSNWITSRIKQRILV